MNHRLVNFILLLICLMLNIVFTQKMVHQFKFENYEGALLYCLLNLLVFPIALFVYKRDRKQSEVMAND
ncbi:hypothetical protein J27TS8_10410 [Robertmurraya siralis]|uniref:Uncharacterized protein n=1 Tax=Robertmurraya siralis TaxID=77777 RepID=A0A919WFJ7_9BACI|nr:hypothetical protein CHH80_00875 [Bacillus sp. 7504-2]GIN61048.1 hypothetical protein J27TS8_10410 [Robertmurraya siralis]